MLQITDNQHAVLDEALRIYGAEAQIKKIVEELTELSLALQHGLKNGFATPENVEEETADAFITLQYLTRLFSEQRIQQVVEQKIDRLEKKIAKTTYKNF